jgi:hypothetical protein
MGITNKVDSGTVVIDIISLHYAQSLDYLVLEYNFSTRLPELLRL